MTKEENIKVKNYIKHRDGMDRVFWYRWNTARRTRTHTERWIEQMRMEKVLEKAAEGLSGEIMEHLYIHDIGRHSDKGISR